MSRITEIRHRLKQALGNLRDRVRQVGNIANTIKKARAKRDRRAKVARKLQHRADAKRDRYNELIDEGHGSNEPEMQKRADEYRALLAKADRKRSSAQRITHRIVQTLSKRARQRRRQKSTVAGRVNEIRGRLARAIRRRKRRQNNDGCNPDKGAWAGSYAAGECQVLRVVKAYGVTITSRKRSWSAVSDHCTCQPTAYAWDIGTFNGVPIAAALARALGISGWTPGNYNPYYIYSNGRRYRVQILWAVEGHYNHVHLGIKLA